jgi:flagellar protein FlbT
MYERSHEALIRTFKSQDVLDGLMEVKSLMERGRTFETLRKIRALFPLEDEILKTRKHSAVDLPAELAKKSVA